MAPVYGRNSMQFSETGHEYSRGSMNRRNFLHLAARVGVGAGIGLLACDGFTSGRDPAQKTKDTANMEPAIRTAIEPGVMPPIDAAAPARFETATFALG